MINQTNLLECLRELGDQRFQKQVWSGQVPDQMSSFAELVCQVFDDTGLSDALESGVLHEELGEDIAGLVQRLDAAISKVDTALPVSELVASRAMQEVRKLANAMVEVLESRRGEERPTGHPSLRRRREDSSKND